MSGAELIMAAAVYALIGAGSYAINREWALAIGLLMHIPAFSACLWFFWL